MRADHLGDLCGIDLGVEVPVEHDLSQLGHQSGVVIGGEEGRIDAEDFSDPHQHCDCQRPHVVFDLVEVAR